MVKEMGNNFIKGRILLCTMKKKTLISLICAALGSIGCAHTKTKEVSYKELDFDFISEYRGSKEERVTTVLYCPAGYKNMRTRQLDIHYPNGVDVRIVDVFDDGTIDAVTIVNNPKNIYIIRDAAPDQEIMELSDTTLKRYLSYGKYRGVE